MCACTNAFTQLHPQLCCNPVNLLIGKCSIFKNGISAYIIVEDQFEEDAGFGHFWPVFGLFWPRFECLMVQMSIYFLVLSGLNEINKMIPNNNDQFQESADFGHF